MRLMAIKLVLASILFFQLISLTLALELNIDAPQEVSLNEQFDVSIISDVTDNADVKIIVQDENQATLSRILDGTTWKSSYYYLKTAYPEKNSYTLKIEKQATSAEICAKLRINDKRIISSPCIPITIKSSSGSSSSASSNQASTSASTPSSADSSSTSQQNTQPETSSQTQSEASQDLSSSQTSQNLEENQDTNAQNVQNTQPDSSQTTTEDKQSIKIKQADGVQSTKKSPLTSNVVQEQKTLSSSINSQDQENDVKEEYSSPQAKLPIYLVATFSTLLLTILLLILYRKL